MTAAVQDKNPRMRAAAGSILHALLDSPQVRAELSVDNLRAAAILADTTIEVYVGTNGCGSVGYSDVYATRQLDLAPVRQLARQELIERGLEA